MADEFEAVVSFDGLRVHELVVEVAVVALCDAAENPLRSALEASIVAVSRRERHVSTTSATVATVRGVRVKDEGVLQHGIVENQSFTDSQRVHLHIFLLGGYSAKVLYCTSHRVNNNRTWRYFSRIYQLCQVYISSQRKMSSEIEHSCVREVYPEP